MKSEQLRKTRDVQRPGITPYLAARMLNMGWPRFKRAIDAGEVKVLSFGGRRYVPKSEIDRLKKLLEDM